MKKVTEAMRGVDRIATTTDCWSARRRSFIGVTAHWIDPDNLNRCSAALACKRLRGLHTFDVLAGALNDIHSEFEIRGKIVRTTTDNGSNFLKAFQVFGEDENPKTVEAVGGEAAQPGQEDASKTKVRRPSELSTTNLLITKLDRLKLSLKYCKPLVDALQLGLKKHFSHMFHDPELIAAAILLPKCKTTWAKDDATIRMGMDYIKDHLEEPLLQLGDGTSSSDEEDFFSAGWIPGLFS
ncbi:hypothetical protein J4Q44_G00067490 [Coregonus suidteri]|uniref:Uncharacterized protein n=1 Tax=Coregonus suidteri TaxID=861788 RepID=A0AAN8M9F0_9TELE